MGRLDPLPISEWPPEMRAALAALTPPNPRHPLPERNSGRPKGLNALGVFARHPELTHAFNTFNGHVLFATTLSTRQRELIVLRVAALRDSAYERAQHIVIANDVGLTEDEIERTAIGGDAEGWSELDAALLTATDDLVRDGRIGDAAWSTLAAHLEPQQLLDVVFTVGAYDLVAMTFNTFDVELDEDLRSWKRPSP